MAIIVWKEIYATGIVALDKEHQQLVAQINRLFEAIRDKQADAVLAEIMQMLEHYTEEHFAHEERLLAEYGFPDLEEHREKHQYLSAALQRLKTQVAEGPQTQARELLKLLRVWLLQHIVGVDQQYGGFLEARAGRFVD